MKVSYVICENYKGDLPHYETELAAGFDLTAGIKKEVIVQALGGRLLIPTGLKVDVPEGYELQVRPRSGLALKHGLTVLNTPGTVDADYRGEVGVIVINTSHEDYIIKPGDRIAQGVISKIEQAEFNRMLCLDETDRGSGGFGSTGR